MKISTIFAGYLPGSIVTGTIHALGLNSKQLIARGVIEYDEERNEYILL